MGSEVVKARPFLGREFGSKWEEEGMGGGNGTREWEEGMGASEWERNGKGRGEWEKEKM